MPLKFFNEDNTSAFADSRMAAEKMICGKTRQVVSVILLAPDGKRFCLTMCEAAKADGRLNLSPPQGGIEEYESIWAATNRVIWEELHVNMQGPVIYLGNQRRGLSADHHRFGQYRYYRYHWVSAYSSGYYLKPEIPLAKVNWYYFDAIDYLTKCMSKEKGEMFRQAVTILQKKAGSNTLIRRSVLEDNPDRLSGTDTVRAVA